jgi:hypothetical protein
VPFAIALVSGCVEMKNQSPTPTLTPIPSPTPAPTLTLPPTENVSPRPKTEDLIKMKIKEKLIGSKLVYFDVAGISRTFEISEKDIKYINKTQVNNQTLWVVRIGEGLAWDLYFDEAGDKLIKEVQLFQT